MKTDSLWFILKKILHEEDDEPDIEEKAEVFVRNQGKIRYCSRR
ncbi:hypothetical protein HanIR_Chr12g0572721 [Helianthus annuus]|nr:hypothetical protein HanIR_Chr12g0572721 [Helianthus annuus]